MLPAKGYIVREITLFHDQNGSPSLRMQPSAGRHSLYHITESPDDLPCDKLPLEELTRTLLKSIAADIPPTLTEEEADWFFDFDEDIELDDKTKYFQLSNEISRSLTHAISFRKAVYTRKKEEKK